MLRGKLLLWNVSFMDAFTTPLTTTFADLEWGLIMNDNNVTVAEATDDAACKKSRRQTGLDQSCAGPRSRVY